MSSKLKTGLIYYLKYNRFRNDPKPLILCLYSNNDITHALNLNYLSPQKINQVVEMVAKIATKKMTKNTYKLYHNFMKRSLPGVVRKSYRVYKTKDIRNPALISRGFNVTRGFMNALKIKYTEKEFKFVKKGIKKEIKFGLNNQNEIDKSIKRINDKHFDSHLSKYLDQIDAIMADQKFDFSKFTK